MQVSLLVSLLSFFFKYECSISRCHLGAKALVSVGIAQMNISQDSILASQWCPTLQNLVPGLCAGILSKVISVDAFVLKKAYRLTP